MIRRLACILSLALLPGVALANASAGVYFYDLDSNLYGNADTYITGSLGSPIAKLDGGYYAINTPAWLNPPNALMGYVYGDGSANDATGTLKAHAMATGFENMGGPWRAAWVESNVSGYITLGSDGTIATGKPGMFALKVDYDGAFSGSAPAPLFGSVDIRAYNTKTKKWSFASDQIDNYSGATASSAILDMVGDIGDEYWLSVALTATVQWCESCESDFSHTAQLSFGTQDGVSIVGNNGFLNAAPTFSITSANIPEPGSVVLMLSGLFGVVGFSSRRSKAKVA